MPDLRDDLLAETNPMVVKGFHDEGVASEQPAFVLLRERCQLGELGTRQEVVRGQGAVVPGVNSDGVNERPAVHRGFYARDKGL